MPITISGSTGIAGVDGSAGTPAVQGTDTNTGLWFPAADTIAWATGGTERARIDSSGNLQFNSGYGSVATAYGCRAWVNFNGTGTVAIRASGNITSITDNGVGNYTLNFTNTFPDANYIGAGMCKNNDDLNDTWVVQMQNTNTKTTTAFQFFTREGGSVNDSSEVHMMIVR